MTKPIALVCLGIFVSRLGGFFVLFLTLVLAERGYGTRQITLALIVVATAGVLGAAAAGPVAARVGVRTALLLTGSVTAAGAFLCAALQDFAPTVALAAVVSAGVQAYSPLAQTVVGTSATAERRVAMFAVYRLCLNVGASVGPVLGALLLSWSPAAVLVGNGLAATVATLLVLPLPRATPRSVPGPDRSPVAQRSRVSGEFAAAAVVLSVASLVYAQQTGVLALAVREADYSTDVYGWLLTLNAVVVILVEVPLSRYTGRWQRRTPLILGTVFVCAGYAVNLAGISLPVLIIGVLSWTLGEVLMTPVAAAFATEAAPPSQESVYLSFLSMCQTVGYAVGPAAGVYAYGQHAALPWLMCAGLMVVSAPALYYLLPRAQWRAQTSEDCQVVCTGLGSVDAGDPQQGRRG
ncbi:MFS transporter [Streptomyces sp. NBC_00285]|uniref:MFS transporter n=1 Tax=Streptomyces sp. NBC_00285 TaxID=2975700 RepID=UPI002E2A3D3F|nr:MFS transporter [Streptomyces sp. NBC_00285]